MLPAHPLRAFVLAHDPDGDGMTVMLSSGQMPALPVRRLYHGTADSHRISKPPLPVRGSWGLVVFPGGDIRNAVWLGTYHPHQMDAITSDNDDPFNEYHAHFSGHWSLIQGNSGFVSVQFADGSSFNAGSGLQTTYRHIVDGDQKRQRQEYKFSDRNPNPQPTFSYSFAQSGTSFTINLDKSGNSTLIFNTGKTLTIQQSGTSFSFVVDGNGNLTVKGTSSITLDTPLVHFTGNIKADGEVTAKATGVAIQTSAHTHGGVQTGPGQTAPPTAGT